MGNFSKPPNDVLQASLAKGYIGVRIEQGVPVLDRDLNLMSDIIAATVRSIVARYIGDGVIAGSSGFAIQALTGLQSNNNFRIAAGTILIGGIEAINPANINYTDQPGVPPLTAAGAQIRTDTVYLDVSFSEADGTADADLLNTGDVGLQTSVRQKVVWVARVAENTTSMPAPAPGHTHFLLARLARTQTQITAAMITDLRKQIISLAEVEARLRILSQPAFAASPNQFTPKSAAPAGNVTLFGKNFNLGGLRVRFDSINFPGSSGNADIVSGPTDAQVVVRVPSTSAGPHKITIETNSGIDTSDDTFTLLAPAPPAPAFDAAPNQFSPKIGPVGATVTLSGNNFNVGGLTVRFGSTNATIIGTPTATRVTVQVPSVAAAGPVRITVETAGGSDLSDETFNVLAAPSFDPSPNQFTPKSGAAGTSVTLLGGNFIADGLIVRFGSVRAASAALLSPQRIVVAVPPGVTGGVRITVITDGGQAVSADAFTVLTLQPPIG